MKKKQVLVIEDDREYLDPILEYLKKHDRKPVFYENVRKSLLDIYFKDFDYYLIDVDSDLDEGLYFISFLIELKSKPRIVAISDAKDILKESKIRRHDITYLLKKPFTAEELDQIFTVKTESDSGESRESIQ